MLIHWGASASAPATNAARLVAGEHHQYRPRVVVEGYPRRPHVSTPPVLSRGLSVPDEHESEKDNESGYNQEGWQPDITHPCPHQGARRWVRKRDGDSRHCEPPSPSRRRRLVVDTTYPPPVTLAWQGCCVAVVTDGRGVRLAPRSKRPRLVGIRRAAAAPSAALRAVAAAPRWVTPGGRGTPAGPCGRCGVVGWCAPHRSP
jgi:hypothetical protein